MSRMEGGNDGSAPKMAGSRGAWTEEEDRKLKECVSAHGAQRWNKLAQLSGLDRCGKSCRLRWLNYLRPDIKRGGTSEDEEELILRLHKLLGNRWSLIAGRLPGRTDNEIKNYCNSLRKKAKSERRSTITHQVEEEKVDEDTSHTTKHICKGESSHRFDIDEVKVDEFIDLLADDSGGLEWVDKFLTLDEEGAWLDDENNVSG